MKASELRIGNYVMAINNYEDIFYVNCIYGHRDLNITAGMYINYDTSIRNIKPIPLTEEWLLKFGFSLMKDTTPYNYRLHKNKSFVYIRYGSSSIYKNGIEEHLKGFNGLFIANKFVRVIQYVHQLQNLYFALTGVELTIKK